MLLIYICSTHYRSWKYHVLIINWLIFKLKTTSVYLFFVNSCVGYYLIGNVMQVYIKPHFFFVKEKFPPSEANSKKLKRQMLSLFVKYVESTQCTVRPFSRGAQMFSCSYSPWPQGGGWVIVPHAFPQRDLTSLTTKRGFSGTIS